LTAVNIPNGKANDRRSCCQYMPMGRREQTHKYFFRMFANLMLL